MHEQRAMGCILNALHFAGVLSKVKHIQVQREPFEARGTCAELFVTGTRFIKERLFHIEIDFETPVAGMLLIGDGRFLGLGLLAPQKKLRTSTIELSHDAQTSA